MEVHDQQPKKTVIGYPINPAKQTQTLTLTKAATSSTEGSSVVPKSELKRGLLCTCASLVLFIMSLVGFCITEENYTPEFHVESVIVYPFNISSSYINANWNITFSVKARSIEAYCFYLDDVHASVFYQNVSIKSKSMRPFYANQKVQANVGVSLEFLNSSIGKDMVADWSLGAVYFNIKINATVWRFNYVNREEKMKHLSVSCEDVTIEFPPDMESPGTMMGASRKCK